MQAREDRGASRGAELVILTMRIIDAVGAKGRRRFDVTGTEGWWIIRWEKGASLGLRHMSTME